MTVYTWCVGIVTAIICVTTVVRIARDPRRPAHAIWVVTSLLSVWLFVMALAAAFNPNGAIDLIFGVVMPLLVPLVLVGAALGLFANTAVVVRREGLRLATLVPAAIGGAIIVTLLVSALWIDYVTSSFLLTAVLPLAILPGALMIVELTGFVIYSAVYAWLPRRGDAEIVTVLGCGLNGDRVTPLLASRLDRGIEAFEQARKERGGPWLVVSGGKGADEHISEAEAMGRYAVTKGVPPDRIVYEAESTTTEENLRFTLSVLRERSIAWTRMLVVTNNFHALRAGSLARRYGIAGATLGAPTALYYLPAAFLREFAAVVTYYRKANLVMWVGLSGAWLASWCLITLVVVNG